ncbi:hypothetical protein M569_02120, partial [Genlisea aurea]
MAKAVALVGSLLFCVLAIAAAHKKPPPAAAHNRFFDVVGEVYCDPCRVQFMTELSRRLVGATVRLQCHRYNDTGCITYSVEGKTGFDGRYRLQVKGDHESDLCFVKVIGSPRADCAVPMTDVVESRIVCTKNVGISSPVRYANPLGFMTRAAAPRCLPVLK